MKNDCSIVKDLIPLYAEDLVSEDTKAFICEHCKSCENCKELLEALSNPVDEQDTTDSKKEKVWSEIASKERKKKKRKYMILSLASVILITFIVLSFIFLHDIIKSLQKSHYENQDIQYNLTYTELTSTKTHFTENDIYAASEAVKKFFDAHSDDRKLLRLVYDEKKTTDENKSVTNQELADAIAFMGDYYFFEDPVAGDSNRLRTNWIWWVKKDSNGEWKIITQGYG